MRPERLIECSGIRNGARPDRPGDAMLELAAEIQPDDGEWDDWEESTVGTLIVDHRHAPTPPPRGRRNRRWPASRTPRRDQRRLNMRQVHRPGEKLFLDYSGKKPRIG